MMPGGRVVEGLAEFGIGYVTQDRTHLFMGGACHRVGHETHRIGQGLFGRFEPNEAAGTGGLEPIELSSCDKRQTTTDNRGLGWPTAY
jgi:hypothetical protein